MKQFLDGMNGRQLEYYHAKKRKYYDPLVLFYAKLVGTPARSGSEIGDPRAYLTWLFEHHPKEWLQLLNEKAPLQRGAVLDEVSLNLFPETDPFL